MLDLKEWHARFEQQAAWTEPVRHYLLQAVQTRNQVSILETGCGTGALTRTLHAQISGQITGIDLDFHRLGYAQSVDPISNFACADGLRLPFPPVSFDLVICHYYLLWVGNPSGALREMRRVTRRGGWVLAFAEPDHEARIDHPARLAELGKLQTQALRHQGADTCLGRRLADLFLQAGLGQVRSGLSGGEWQHPAPQQRDLEWQVLEDDLRGSVTPSQLAEYQAAELAARARGERILFVPTFYAMGMA